MPAAGPDALPSARSVTALIPAVRALAPAVAAVAGTTVAGDVGVMAVMVGTTGRVTARCALTGAQSVMNMPGVVSRWRALCVDPVAPAWSPDRALISCASCLALSVTV